MKAWIVYYYDEWCSLVHAETRGKACAYIKDIIDTELDFLDFRAIRIPGLDNKPITYLNTVKAGFRYQIEDDVYNPPIFTKPEYFVNDCNCKICKEQEKMK
ncbi:MAG: hypothetical protein KKC55_14845 [Gammaproteobacteria bacterium]|uniref:Uncharacterized protein n=1 Tax=viral metagenome TaxID=1070528 RepID=A0A6M3X7U6_9ZZZZ|nr:hypothetical protein [Gammaproteobacteria bacterium]